jgi:hypothetical protein
VLPLASTHNRRPPAAEYDPESVPKAASFTALRFADPTPLLEGLSAAGFQEVQREELLVSRCPTWLALMSARWCVLVARLGGVGAGMVNMCRWVYKGGRQRALVGPA